MELKIVDPEAGDERAAGDVGEIRVRGPSVMPRLLRALEEETEDAFDDDGWFCAPATAATSTRRATCS